MSKQTDQQSNPITRQLLKLDLSELEQRIGTVQLDQKDYQAVIFKLINDLRQVKGEQDKAQKQIGQLKKDLNQDQQHITELKEEINLLKEELQIMKTNKEQSIEQQQQKFVQQLQMKYDKELTQKINERKQVEEYKIKQIMDLYEIKLKEQETLLLSLQAKYEEDQALWKQQIEEQQSIIEKYRISQQEQQHIEAQELNQNDGDVVQFSEHERIEKCDFCIQKDSEVQSFQQFTDFSQFDQKMNQLNDKVIEIRNSYQQNINQIQIQLEKIEEQKNQIEELRHSNQQLLIKLAQFESISEQIIPNDCNIEKTLLIKEVESMWMEVYKSCQTMKQKLNQFFQSDNIKSDQDFLQCQEKYKQQISLTALDQIKAEFQNNSQKTENLKQYIERYKSTQKQETQTILTQVIMLVDQNKKVIENSLKLIDYVVKELEIQKYKTEKFLKISTGPEENIQQIISDHENKISNLEKQFTQQKEELSRRATHYQIHNIYNKNKIKELSNFSLKIHSKFYEKIEQSLSDLIISFMNISIRNILGVYLSSKGNNDESKQRKQEIISKVKKFKDQIKNGENNQIENLINNSRGFLGVFEESFLSLKGDSKSKCFNKSFVFSQRAIDLLENYIQCIQQGVQEFIKDHNQLIEQEN